MLREAVAIYIARGLVSGLLKIGRTRDVPQRLKGLASRVEPMELLATMRAPARVERELHRRFAAALEPSRGREWFRDDGAIRAFLDTLDAAQRGSVVFTAGERRPQRRLTDAERAANRARPTRPQSDAVRDRYNATMAARRQRIDAARVADPLLYPLVARPLASQVLA
jgi:hypothetical protein